MSKEENRGMIDAYQKMLQNGSAFKEVDMRMDEAPSLGMAERGLGDAVDTRVVEQEQEQEQNFTDYSEHDSVMQERINSLRNKMNGGGGTRNSGSPQQELISLKKRVAKLEEALMLIMETHEKLIG
jgi:predicted  nucleic acid-binding Zn-ribbon protein